MQTIKIDFTLKRRQTHCNIQREKRIYLYIPVKPHDYFTFSRQIILDDERALPYYLLLVKKVNRNMLQPKTQSTGNDISNIQTK